MSGAVSGGEATGAAVNAGGAGGVPERTPLLRAEGLAIGWGRRRNARILAATIGIELHAGSFVALLGPNGAGKSTLLRSLTGLQEPMAGTVELGGQSIESLSVEERARRAAVVLTERFDPGWFTVFDLVAFGRYPYTDARNRLSPRDRSLVEEALRDVGLGGFGPRRFSELSDGERQKALVARAVAQESPLLVLDEPTAFLDAPARIEVFHLARRLATSGRAVVLSTHEVELALENADEVWLLDRAGRFERGAPELLSRSGSIGRAFDLPGLRFDPETGAFRPTGESD